MFAPGRYGALPKGALTARSGHAIRLHAAVQPGTRQPDQQTGADPLAVALQGEIQRVVFQSLDQGRLQVVGRAFVGVLDQADLAVSPIQIQLDGALCLGRCIDDFGGFKLNAVRNLDFHPVR